MKVLILGGGGREHALAWKIAQSPLCEGLFCAPGNPGISQVADCVTLNLRPPFERLIGFCRQAQIDLVVVGPEDPLAAGVVDALEAAGVPAFGPGAAAARLEASKSFAKEIMTAAGIPTGAACPFTEASAAREHLNRLSPPYVIKADGLAAGKGVVVANDRAQAEDWIDALLEGRRLGEAGARILIEEYLTGIEASLLAFTDGRTVLAMEPAHDHKPVFDGDRGPNTGGMGAVSPAAAMTPGLRRRAVEEILKPAVAELARRGLIYRGVLYAGLMLTAEGPKVVEFNCRFGDPETQALLPRLTTDLVPLLLACREGTLAGLELAWRPEACVCVVAAAAGYPGPSRRGDVIGGLEGDGEDVMIFHAGTAFDADGRIVTAGGRVLGVTALGSDAAHARDRAYARLERIRFSGMHFRRDIGLRRAGVPASV